MFDNSQADALTQMKMIETMVNDLKNRLQASKKRAKSITGI